MTRKKHLKIDYSTYVDHKNCDACFFSLKFEEVHLSKSIGWIEFTEHNEMMFSISDFMSRTNKKNQQINLQIEILSEFLELIKKLKDLSYEDKKTCVEEFIEKNKDISK